MYLIEGGVGYMYLIEGGVGYVSPQKSGEYKSSILEGGMGAQSRPAGTASLVRSAPIEGCGLRVPTFLFHREGNPREKVG